MQDIHAIRPPVQVGIDPIILYILVGIFIAIFIIGLIFFLVRKWLKNKKNRTQENVLPALLPPYKAAINSLKRLSRSANIDPRLFYFDLTRVLRKYIGDSFHTNAIEMTSQEFIKSLGKIDLENKIRQEIIQFQKYCDPFKYAGILPNHNSGEESKDQSIQLDLHLVETMIAQIEDRLTENRLAEKNQIEKNQVEKKRNEKNLSKIQLTKIDLNVEGSR